MGDISISFNQVWNAINEVTNPVGLSSPTTLRHAQGAKKHNHHFNLSIA